MTLANAQPHKVYTVIRTDGEMAIRLAELGFAEGSTVIVTGVSPTKGAVLALLRGRTVALPASVAASVSVRE